jgi:hypothetical protein
MHRRVALSSSLEISWHRYIIFKESEIRFNFEGVPFMGAG